MNPTDTFAVDTFRQSSVGLAAERVVERCLIGQSLIGLDWPSAAEHVYAKIVRTDAPFNLMSLQEFDVQNVSLPNTTSVLQIVMGSVLDIIIGGSSDSSASRLVIDQ